MSYLNSYNSGGGRGGYGNSDAVPLVRGAAQFAGAANTSPGFNDYKDDVVYLEKAASQASYATPTQVNPKKSETYFTNMALFFMIIVSGIVSAVVYPLVLRKSAETVFSSDSPRLGFQPSVAQARSTMDIAFACIATMAICVISAVHFDIPDRGQRASGFWGILFSGDNWKRALFKFFTWTGGILAPEGIGLWAYNEYTAASEDVKFMKDHGFSRWSMKHSFFASMGGFRLESGAHVTTGRQLLEMSDSERGFFVRQLDFDTIESDILDKSKADILTKLIAIFQITRFVAGTVVRKLQKLPVAPIEYVTCAYAFCAFLIYLVWFHKAYDVQEPLRLAPNYVLPLEMVESIQPRKRSKSHFFSAVVAHVAGFILFISPLLLGAGHLFSWNLEFVLHDAQLMWRVSSIAAIVFPPVFAIAAIKCNEPKYRRLWASLLVASGIAYLIARYLLLYLIVYSFWSLPAGVYQTQDINWIVYIPFFH